MTNEPPSPGTIAWWDLAVPDATAVRDFYAAVAGWRAEPVDMGDHDDFAMASAVTGETVAGICHARGDNAGLPAQWLPYVAAPDVEASLRVAIERGGEVVTAVREAGGAKFVVVRDPAGAAFALIETGAG